ncbi:MAG: ABC transporter permease [Planctomycetes bacterium]|nr:ABC transporter permease [Planctomycetota bacterium]
MEIERVAKTACGQAGAASQLNVSIASGEVGAIVVKRLISDQAWIQVLGKRRTGKNYGEKRGGHQPSLAKVNCRFVTYHFSRYTTWRLPLSKVKNTGEIGMRKAIGASRCDLAWQFLVEAIDQ